MTEFRIQLCLVITNKQERLDEMTRQNIWPASVVMLYHLNLRNVLKIFTVPQATIFCIFMIWTVDSFLSKPRSCSRDITKFCNNYRNHIKFIMWVHDLEVTYQKPINIDHHSLRDVNVSWATKFNNWARLIRFVPYY